MIDFNQILQLKKAQDKLTARQKYIYNRLNGNEYKTEYLKTLLGLSRRSRVDFDYYRRRITDDASGRKGQFAGVKVYEQGELVNIIKQHHKDAKDATKFKKPLLKTGDYIGIELEVILPMSEFTATDGECECVFDDEEGEVIETCTTCDGNDSSNYMGKVVSKINNLGLKGIQVVTDGSLRPDSGEFGLEFKVLMRENDFSSLEGLCKFLNDHKARVNKSCGLHVHLDASRIKETDIQDWAKRFGNSIPMLSKFVPESRVNNQYCQSRMSFEERYSAVNGSAYFKHKTIEVRLHTGSTDFTKIKNWVSLLVAIKHSDEMETYKPRKLSTFFASINLNAELVKFYTERCAKFNYSWLVANEIGLVHNTDGHSVEESEAA